MIDNKEHTELKRTFNNRIEYHNDKEQLHRLDGPAIEYKNGTKKWIINGKFHRVDGPAIEWSTGSKEWWINGRLHREDGPAIIFHNGEKQWYLNYLNYTEEQWSQEVTKIKLKRILYL